MLKDMSRSRVIQVWFAALTLIVVVGVTLGTTVTVGTGVLLLAVSLVPPAIVLVLWPRPQPVTVGDVLRGADRRA